MAELSFRQSVGEEAKVYFSVCPYFTLRESCSKISWLEPNPSELDLNPTFVSPGANEIHVGDFDAS